MPSLPQILTSHELAPRDVSASTVSSIYPLAMKCYAIPYGGIGFAGDVLALYIFMCIAYDKSPLPLWRPLRRRRLNRWLAGIQGLCCEGLEMYSLIKCKFRGELVIISIAKMAFAFYITVVLMGANDKKEDTAKICSQDMGAVDDTIEDVVEEKGHVEAVASSKENFLEGMMLKDTHGTEKAECIGVADSPDRKTEDIFRASMDTCVASLPSSPTPEAADAQHSKTTEMSDTAVSIIGPIDDTMTATSTIAPTAINTPTNTTTAPPTNDITNGTTPAPTAGVTNEDTNSTPTEPGQKTLSTNDIITMHVLSLGTAALLTTGTFLLLSTLQTQPPSFPSPNEPYPSSSPPYKLSPRHSHHRTNRTHLHLHPHPHITPKYPPSPPPPSSSSLSSSPSSFSPLSSH